MGRDILGVNTYPFWVPERVDAATYKTNWCPPDTSSHMTGPEANVWGVGMIIYLLMTNQDIGDISDQVNWKLGANNPDRDNSDIDKYLFEIEEFPTYLADEEDYSDLLKNLVRECTRLEPLKRPQARTICAAIHKGITEEYERLQKEFNGDENWIRHATRVATSDHEWVRIPQGPFSMMPMPVSGVTNNAEINNVWREYESYVVRWHDMNAPVPWPPGASTGAPVPPNVGMAGRSFIGSDWVLYMNQKDFGYAFQGEQLPRGGRAWRTQYQ